MNNFPICDYLNVIKVVGLFARMGEER